MEMRYIPRQFSTVIPQVPYHRTLANSRFDPGKTGIPGTPLKGHYRSTNSIPTFATSRTVYRPSMMTSQTIINVDLRPMDAPSGNRISERKLTREELRTLADRFLLYINTDNADPEELAKMVANDVATPLFYPGMRSGWAGLSDILAKLHGALTDYSMQLVTPIVDEEGQIVVFFVQSVGVQTGEWRGLPGSGTPFDHYGFLMMKMDPRIKLITEINLLLQETLYLKQIGVIPYGRQ